MAIINFFPLLPLVVFISGCSHLVSPDSKNIIISKNQYIKSDVSFDWINKKWVRILDEGDELSGELRYDDYSRSLVYTDRKTNTSSVIVRDIEPVYLSEKIIRDYIFRDRNSSYKKDELDKVIVVYVGYAMDERYKDKYCTIHLDTFGSLDELVITKYGVPTYTFSSYYGIAKKTDHTLSLYKKAREELSSKFHLIEIEEGLYELPDL